MPTLRPRFAILAFVAVFLLAACASGAGASPSANPSSPTPNTEPVTTAEQAFARIVALEPRLAGTGPVELDVIGQSAWYEATPVGDDFRVEVYIGWGDCMAGCIDHHSWLYTVTRDGTVALVEEEGSPVLDSEWPSPAGSGGPGIFGTALAGPTCPVEQPGDPSCDPRPVAGATIRVTDAQGAEVGTVVTDANGRFFVALPAGTYTVTAPPVEGLMGFPAPITVEVTDGETVVELPYDTGIR
jgi:hypothetical protein